MKKCSTCNKRILFGSKKVLTEIYCTSKCQEVGLRNASVGFLSEETLLGRLKSLHQGACPKCNGVGPNDIQTHYSIWSLIYITSHKSVPEVCCKSCGIKKKLGGLFFSLFFGWWGIPFGIILTPIQIIRNIIALFHLPSSDRVSKGLNDYIRKEAGAQALIEKAESLALATPPPLS